MSCDNTIRHNPCRRIGAVSPAWPHRRRRQLVCKKSKPLNLSMSSLCQGLLIASLDIGMFYRGSRQDQTFPKTMGGASVAMLADETRPSPSSRIGPFSRIRPVEDQRVNKKGLHYSGGWSQGGGMELGAGLGIADHASLPKEHVSGNQTHSASLGNRVGLHYSRFRLFERANSVKNQWLANSIRTWGKSRAGMRLSEVASALCGPDLFQACRFPRRSPFPSCRVATLRP